jgi:hypothetical protein
MTLSAAAGSLNTTTAAAGNTVVVSGLGFQPKIVFFWWSGRTETVDTAGRRTHQRGFGAAISATDRREMTSLSQDTPTAMLTNRAQDDTECIFLTTTADAIDGKMDLQSMDAGGFTLVIDDAFTADYRIHYLALGGADLTDVVGSSFTAAAVTGDQDITSLAFQPDLVIAWGSGQGTMNGTIGADSSLVIGAAVNNTQYAVLTGGSNDAATTSQAMSYCTNDNFLVTFNAGVTSLNNRATFVQMLSNGFRINWSPNAATADQYNFVALKGAGFRVGTLLTQTDTTTDIVASGFGFTPRAGLVFSHGKAESTLSTAQDDDEWSIGGFSSTTARAACAVADDDAAGFAIVSSAIEHDEVYVNLDANTGAIEALMDIKSIDSDGFTFIMDDAEPSQTFVWYVAFGDTPIVGSTITPADGAATVSSSGAATAQATPSAAVGAATPGAVGRSTATTTPTTAAGAATTSAVGQALSPATISPAVGVATPSAVGRSTATTTPTTAAGVATTGLLASAVAQAQAVAAAGAATPSAAGRATAQSQIVAASALASTSASGAAQAQAQASAAAGLASAAAGASALAAATISPAAGAATASVVSAGGASVVSPAAGAAVVSGAGMALATATPQAVAGAATTGLLASATAQASISPAAGAATASVASGAGGSTISPAVGAAVASLLARALATTTPSPALGLAVVQAVGSGGAVVVIDYRIRARRPGGSLAGSQATALFSISQPRGAISGQEPSTLEGRGPEATITGGSG